jgi:hypothetical protein
MDEIAVFCDLYNFTTTGGISPTLNAASCNSANHSGPNLIVMNDQGGAVMDVKCLNPWDVQCKHIVTPDGVSESICAGEKRWGALPPNVCYAIDSHPEDSRFRIDGGAMPSLTVKIAKGSADGPLVLIENERICCGTSFAGQQGKDKR